MPSFIFCFSTYLYPYFSFKLLVFNYSATCLKWSPSGQAFIERWLLNSISSIKHINQGLALIQRFQGSVSYVLRFSSMCIHLGTLQSITYIHNRDAKSRNDHKQEPLCCSECGQNYQKAAAWCQKIDYRNS